MLFRKIGISVAPISRSVIRGQKKVEKKAELMYHDETFQSEMKELFKRSPSGILEILTKDDLLQRIEKLEKQVHNLEKHVYAHTKETNS